MDKQTQLSDEVVDLGAVTEETRGNPIGVAVDDKSLYRASPALSDD